MVGAGIERRKPRVGLGIEQQAFVLWDLNGLTGFLFTRQVRRARQPIDGERL